MSDRLTAVHLSGDLGQAVATAGDTTWLIDPVDQRAPLPNEVQLFFASAAEIVAFDDEMLSDLTLDKIQEMLREKAPGFELLDLLLAGMDRELSARVRLDAIDAAAELALRADSFAFAQRRLLRATDGKIWNPESAAQLADKHNNRAIAELYNVISGPLVPRIEAGVLSWHASAGSALSESTFLDVARDTGLIAEVAMAAHRRDWDVLRAATAATRDLRILGLARYLQGVLIPPPAPPSPLPSPPEEYSFGIDDDFRSGSSRRFGRSSWVGRRFTFDSYPLSGGIDDRLLLFALDQGRLDRLIASNRFGSPELVDASLHMANTPCFFVDDPYAKWDLRRDELLRTLYDHRFQISPLPSRKQVRNFTRKRALTLGAILKIELALEQLSFSYRETALPRGLGEGSIIPSFFVAEPEDLRELREQERYRAAEISALVFGPAGNVWGRLERGDVRDRIGITWATVEKIASVLGGSAFEVFRPGYGLSGRLALRALDSKRGNIIASSR